MVARVFRRKAVFLCPYCSSPLFKRTSFLAHRFLRNDVFVCENPLCSAAFNATTEITHIASPTGIPHAMPCELPDTPHLLRQKIAREHRALAGDRQLDLLADVEDEE